MSATVTSPLRHSHAEALTVAQLGSEHVQRDASLKYSSFSMPFIGRQEPAEYWTRLENMLYACLRTGDDKAAHFCLEKLAGRFGASNERVMGLRGLYQEALAEDRPALLHVLREYDAIIARDPTNIPVKKRRVAVLCSLSREADAIHMLVELLETCPTDIESWAELSELYISQGFYQQAEFCLEEIILSTPNAWNAYPRAPRRSTIHIINLISRPAWVLGRASERLVAEMASTTQSSGSNGGCEIPLPSVESVQMLNQQATSVLTETTKKVKDVGHTTPDLTAMERLLKPSTRP
ncbi:MAG: hypothetical protein Q9222_001778 [Ikaeria aurantiellina]